MVYIYVLKLEQGKYYIGKTNNPSIRIDVHFHSNGAAWTKLYNPIKLVELIPNCDDYDEDKYTKIYMDKYGIDNVRGGSFVSVKLDKSIIDCLVIMNNSTNNRCFSCGNEGHFAKDCHVLKENLDKIGVEENIEENISGCSLCRCLLNIVNKLRNGIVNCLKSIIKIIEHSDTHNTHSTPIPTYIDKKMNCVRCGRNGHNISTCYAKKHIKGYYINKN